MRRWACDGGLNGPVHGRAAEDAFVRETQEPPSEVVNVAERCTSHFGDGESA